MKRFTIEHNFTFFVMCDLKLESEVFQCSVDPTPCLPHFVQYAKRIIYGVVHVRHCLVLKICHLFIQLLQPGF